MVDVCQECLILFTRFPIAGRAKTRLIPVLGAEGAAKLHRRLTVHALRTAERSQLARGTRVQVHFEGADGRAMSHWLGDRFEFVPQTTGDLGQRMRCAFENAFAGGCGSVVIIGSDCPDLSPAILDQAFAALRDKPVVFGPATDGGYYLLGLRSPLAKLFLGPRWGTGTVLADSLEILSRAGLGYSLLKPLADVDRPKDLLFGLASLEHEADFGEISVIIPSLNEQDQIAETVNTALREKPLEVIVVDGGSQDQTVERARAAGATTINSGPGRARQLNAGASRAHGRVLLFIHADTVLPDGYRFPVLATLVKPGVAAGAFRFGFAQHFPGSSLVAKAINLRSRFLQIPYGDQGLFLRASLLKNWAATPTCRSWKIMKWSGRFGGQVALKQRRCPP